MDIFADDDSLDKCVDFIAAGYAENIKSCSEVSEYAHKIHLRSFGVYLPLCSI